MSSAEQGSRAGYESARLSLARLRLSGENARDEAMRHVAQTAAIALGVERVGVWAFRRGRTRSECLCEFDASSGAFSSGDVLDLERFPKYLGELATRRVLAVDDARDDPRLGELRAARFTKRPVASLMVAPIIRDGEIAGSVCHMHAGAPRSWSQKDRDFACCVADMAALFLEHAEKLEIESALRKRREIDLVDEKMAALGRLARSVAHDVNNVLGAIGMIGVALGTHADAQVQRHGSVVGEAVKLGGRLIEQLFLFGREAGLPTRVMPLAFLLQRMEPVLRRLMPHARLELEVTVPDASVLAVETEIEQVVLNLVVNAAEAVLEGGLVRIELREPRADEPISPTAVVLAVIDTGKGIDGQAMSHIFEPYFSSKGAGHGIGLATVYGIVKRSGGTILVDSTPAAGTTFRVALPRVVGEVERSQP